LKKEGQLKREKFQVNYDELLAVDYVIQF